MHDKNMTEKRWKLIFGNSKLSRDKAARHEFLKYLKTHFWKCGRDEASRHKFPK
jgi:hypothetical protein